MLSISTTSLSPHTFSKRSSRIFTVSSQTSLLFFCGNERARVTPYQHHRQKQKQKQPATRAVTDRGQGGSGGGARSLYICIA